MKPAMDIEPSTTGASSPSPQFPHASPGRSPTWEGDHRLHQEHVAACATGYGQTGHPGPPLGGSASSLLSPCSNAAFPCLAVGKSHHSNSHRTMDGFASTTSAPPAADQATALEPPNRRRRNSPRCRPWPRLRPERAVPDLSSSSVRRSQRHGLLTSPGGPPADRSRWSRGLLSSAGSLLHPVTPSSHGRFLRSRDRTSTVCLEHFLPRQPVGETPSRGRDQAQPRAGPIAHVAGAEDTSAGEATELKLEFDEDLGHYYISFPDDQ
ncbi:uncharacterized protein LOC125510588 isoform X2 [Triticum urartu]|uniref:uncharacterized protein LOC125510588 isoform X2 n=1 Tax=Triticum urartu TaxID=4572 RepID=UPI002044BCDD|nr:uncharacterized protein LOC125510588 isoform X2 [Triticum urartu]